MDVSAQVRSLDVLRDFRVALVKFRASGAQALAAIEIAIRHLIDWLEGDRLSYWRQQIRLCEDAVHEAKMNLHRCQLMKNPGGETPSCDDEKKLLARAKHRLEEAEEKVERVRYWIREFERELVELSGPLQRVADSLEDRMPIAIQQLDAILGRLEAYLAQAPTASDGAAGVGSAAASGSSDANPSTAEPPASDGSPPADQTPPRGD